jgi:protein-tyrosine phosphatase
MTVQAFDIYDFAGFTAGQLAICPEPATVDAFNKVAKWQPDIVVTMTTVEEFSSDDFAAHITKITPQWMQAAVADFGVPQNDFNTVISRLLDVLNNRGRVLIHCKGGQGRSGMLAMRLLVEQGEPAIDALTRIRCVRPHAVETTQQEQWASQRLT